MKRFDIEAYLAKELKGKELYDFKKELKQNHKFAKEVALMRQLTEDIEMADLRQKVNHALSKPSDSKSSKFGYYWIIGLFVLVGLLFFLWFYFF